MAGIFPAGFIIPLIYFNNKVQKIFCSDLILV